MKPHDVDLDSVAPCGVRLHELRRHLAKELARSDEDRVADHVRRCKTCEARLAELSLEAQRFAMDHDAAAEVHRILERFEAAGSFARTSSDASVIAMNGSTSRDRRRSPSTTSQRENLAPWARLSSRWASLVLAPALILVLASVVLLQPSRVEDEGRPKTPWREGAPALRAKGRPALEMFVNAPSGPERVADGSILREGDQVQFEYRSAGHKFLYILSIDSQGTVSPLFPDTRSESVAVESEGRHILEGSIVLDHAKGPERFVGIFSSEPLSFQGVSEILRAPAGEGSIAGTPNTNDNIDITSISIMKE